MDEKRKEAGEEERAEGTGAGGRTKASGYSRKARDRRGLSPEKGLGLPQARKTTSALAHPPESPVLPPSGGTGSQHVFAAPQVILTEPILMGSQPRREPDLTRQGRGALGFRSSRSRDLCVLDPSGFTGKGGLLGQRGCGTAVKEPVQSSTQKWQDLGPGGGHGGEEKGWKPEKD